jgi:hypothetical protein
MRRYLEQADPQMGGMIISGSAGRTAWISTWTYVKELAVETCGPVGVCQSKDRSHTGTMLSQLHLEQFDTFHERLSRAANDAISCRCGRIPLFLM